MSDVCGNCFWWFQAEPNGPVTIGAPKRGICFGNPPQVVPIVREGQIVGGANIRPQVPENEPVCSLYMSDEDDEENDSAH